MTDESNPNTFKTTIMTVAAMVASAGFVACTSNIDRPAEVSVNTISEQLAAVRDYVPLYAVIAHRGSTYWAPEETESAWRWAREMGADYLESDLQCSKDGVIIANHDDNLKRTTTLRRYSGRTSRPHAWSSTRAWDSRTTMRRNS